MKVRGVFWVEGPSAGMAWPVLYGSTLEALEHFRNFADEQERFGGDYPVGVLMPENDDTETHRLSIGKRGGLKVEYVR